MLHRALLCGHIPTLPGHAHPALGHAPYLEKAEGMEAVLIAWALVKLPNGVPEPAAAYTEALVAEADGPKRGGGGGDAAAGPSDPTDTEQRDAIYRRLWQLLAIAAVRLAPSMERGLGTMLWSFGRAHQDQDGRLAEVRGACGRACARAPKPLASSECGLCGPRDAWSRAWAARYAAPPDGDC
jgi:hypothetical protein